MTYEQIFFTKRELQIIGNLCETMKHWRKHNVTAKLLDSLYEEFENIQYKCTKAIQKYIEEARDVDVFMMLRYRRSI
jgi:hypothetical protein